MPVKSESTSERLKRLGYGHRKHNGPESTKREIYKLAGGDVVGLMDCFEANDFCDKLEDNTPS